MQTRRAKPKYHSRTTSSRRGGCPLSGAGLGLLAICIGALLGGGWWIWQTVSTSLVRSEAVVPAAAMPQESTATATATMQPTSQIITQEPLPAPSIVPTTPPVATTLPTSPAEQFIIRAPELEEVMLTAINRDRIDQGLSPVVWDPVAALAGSLHAADMAANNYFSHWSMNGRGPEWRYQQQGGLHTVMENIYTYGSWWDNGSPAPLNDLQTVVEDAQQALMNSPGHRRNILNPTHTHVGVGFAYNPDTGRFYLAQEFVGQYVGIESMPATARLGDRITVVGRLQPETTDPYLNLTFQTFPESMNIEDLNATSTYARQAEIYASVPVRIDAQGTFRAEVPLDYNGQAGVYSIRVWVTVADEQLLASEWLLDVE
ncbi:MAG: CAP domain-containing protein [Chloroflexaceae bacterium]|nr:CAP domain-containing protein [Chloroflexaceae bacterium]